MTATLTSEFESHFQGKVTTLAICYEVMQKDGTVLRYTNHDNGILYEGAVYRTSDTSKISALEKSTTGAADNMDIEIAFSDAGITKEKIAQGQLDNATIKVFLVNYKDLTMGRFKLVAGNLGEIKANMYGGEFQFKGLAEYLQNNIGRSYSYKCDCEELGDDRCKLNIAGFVLTGTVTSVVAAADKLIFDDSAKSQADDFFTYGTVEFTSGNNNGWTKEVKAFANGRFTLFEDMPYEIEAGDAFTAIAGCDRYPDTCRTKFNNYVNYQGFEHLPGRDELMKYPDAK